MATYYVSSGSGDDSDSGATPELAKKTLQSVLTGTTPSIADGDTVEIIDEETYPENAIRIETPNLTITHTASHLGRPKIDAQYQTWVWRQNTSGTTFQGIEMYNASVAIDRASNSPTGAGTWFHLTGCFIHDVSYLTSQNIVGDSGNKTSINECVLYFFDANVNHINAESNLTLSNSLITASLSNEALVCDFGDSSNTVTASFCTFINTPGGSSSEPIIQVGKAINCIVSGSGHGIASDDHTYNAVITDSRPFNDHDGTSSTAEGTGDINSDPLFVDGTVTGSSPSIAANFKLQSTSPCIDAGTLYDNITTDISGTGRAQQYWSSYSTPTEPKFAGDFTINLYNNIDVQYRRPLPGTNDMGAYEYVDPTATADIYEGTHPAVDQVPFSLGSKGPGSLRGKPGAYGVSKGGNPSTIIQTSSA